MVEANRIDTAYAVPQTAGLTNIGKPTGGTTSALTSGLATGTGLLGHQQPASDWVRKDRGEFLELQPQAMVQPQPVIVQQQQPIIQTQPVQQFVRREEFVGAPTANVIQERPVLDRVEKLLHKEVIQKPLIQEQLRQDIIEVHERPIEKRFMHPMQEFRVQEQGKFEVEGREMAELERNRVLNQIREQDRLRRVQVDQRQDVRVVNDVPQHFQSREMRREIIQKPVVTEIHEQPIREIHEQAIQRTVYQRPIVTVVRDQKVIENLSSSTAIPYEGGYAIPGQQFQQTQFVRAGQPFVQPGIVGSNQYFDERRMSWDDRYEKPHKAGKHGKHEHEKKRDKYYEKYGDDRIYGSDRGFIGGAQPSTYGTSSGLLGTQQQQFIPSTGYSGQQGFIPSTGFSGQQGYGLPQSSQQQRFIPSTGYSGLDQQRYSTGGSSLGSQQGYGQQGLIGQQRLSGLPSQQGYQSGLVPGQQQGLPGSSLLGAQQPGYGGFTGQQQGLGSQIPSTMMQPGLSQPGFGQQGLQQGLQPGLQQGLQPGFQQGLQPGLQQGLQPGLSQPGYGQQGLQQGLQPGLSSGGFAGQQQGLGSQLTSNLMQQGIQQGMSKLPGGTQFLQPSSSLAGTSAQQAGGTMLRNY